MRLKTFLAFFLTAAFCVSPAVVLAAEEKPETKFFHVDSINGTRWADTVVVYRGIPTNGQNQWGQNLVVNAEGVVTRKIPGGDMAGRDLAVPEGGLILTGTGDIGKEIYNAAQVGWHVAFDEYTMTAFISKGEPDPFFEHAVKATGTNGTRWAKSLVIYDRGETTGTNAYGYEVSVNDRGYVTVSGGNDSAIPKGGYVISAIEPENKMELATFFPVGTRVERDGLNIRAVYDAGCLRETVNGEIERLSEEILKAEKELRLADIEEVRTGIGKLDVGSVNTLSGRNELIRQVGKLREQLYERRAVEVRAVWYRPTERTVEEISATVNRMAESGINELILDGASGSGALVTLPEGSPFHRDPTAVKFDLVKEYIKRCHEKGIRLTMIMAVMSNHLVDGHEDWYSLNQNGEIGDESFYSPDCVEYRDAFYALIGHILQNYDIDGLQLDYIRYPYSDGSSDYGFDANTVDAFCKKTGKTKSDIDSLKTKLKSSPIWNEWRNYKTEQITGWVRDLSGIVSELRPDVVLSASVAATGNKNNYCQDANAWADDGIVDALYPMSYAEGINQFSVDRYIDSFKDKGCLVMGCGAYMSLTDNDVLEQTANSSLCGSDGVAYFEWSAYLSHGFAELLENGLFSSKAVHFFDKEAVGKYIETAKKRFELYDKRNSKNLSKIIEPLNAFSTEKDIRSCMEKAGAKAGVEVSGYLLQDLSHALRALRSAKGERPSDGPGKTPDDKSSEDPGVSDDPDPESSAEPAEASDPSGDPEPSAEPEPVSSVSSDEESRPAEQSAAESTGKPSESSEPSSGSGGLPLPAWIAIGVGAAGLIAAAVVLILKKKK